MWNSPDSKETRKDSGDGCVVLSLRQVDAIAGLLPALPETWLGAQEMQRWHSLKAPARRTQFVAGHWLARQAMAQWLGGDATDYILSAPDDGPPVWLDGPQALAWRDVHVSLSHSGNWVACALARHPIGVDIESTGRQRDFAALGQWIGLDLAAKTFAALTPQQQQQTFHTHWTLAEAWFKQAGPAARMQATGFVLGAGGLQALLAQTDDFTLALCPAQAVSTTFADPELAALRWTAWSWSGDDR